MMTRMIMMMRKTEMMSPTMKRKTILTALKTLEPIKIQKMKII
jgi:hypothetical protein